MLQVLEVQHESASWILDAVRYVFWLLAKGMLILLDGMFLIINDIWKFKFFDNTYINTIYKSAIIVACTWLILKVVIELIMTYFVKQDDTTSPTKIFRGIIYAILMMFLIPYLFNWGHDLSSKMTQYVISASSTADTSPTSFEASMSSMILSAFADDDKMNEDDKKYFIENWWSTDYNEVTDDGLLDSGEYKYSFSIFPIFLTGFVVVIMLLFIGIQVAKRIIELALYKAIAPFVCTSLISNRSHTFEVWIKGVMGAFLVTTVQYLCIGILFNVYSSVASGTSYAMTVILIIIGGLLFIISSPQLISALLNANTGAFSNMNELSSLAAVGASIVALSKYGTTNDNSSNTNTSNDNSTSNENSSTSGSNDPNLTNVNHSSNNNSNNNVHDSDSKLNNIQSSNSNFGYSNIDYPNSSFDNIGTSLLDRIDIYKEMTDTKYSNNRNNFSRKDNWGGNDVFNT